MWLCCEVPETFCGWKYFGSCLHKKTNWFLDAFEDEINGNCHKNSCVYAVSKQRFDKQHILYTFNSTIISLCWVGCRLMALSAQVGYIMPRQVNWYAVWGRINKYITLFNLLSPPLARDFLRVFLANRLASTDNETRTTTDIHNMKRLHKIMQQNQSSLIEHRQVSRV